MTDDDDPLAALARIQAEATLRRIIAETEEKHGVRSMVSAEQLLRPLQPPQGLDDPTPVLRTTHEAAVAALHNLAFFVTKAAEQLREQPRCDVLVDVFIPAINTAAELAAEKLAIFRETRDAAGQA